MHRRVLVGLAMLLASAFACRGAALVGPDGIQGVYTLRAVNGAAPPATIFTNEANTRQITGATITLNADRTCRLASSLRDRRAGSDSWVPDLYDLACTYVRERALLRITQENGVQLVATWADGRILLVSDGNELSFER